MRFLAYTTPNLGHLYPLVPILVELRSRGHAVTICTRRDQLEALRRLGLHTIPLDPRIEALKAEDWREHDPIGAVAAAMRFAAVRGHYELEQLPGLVEENEPAALIVDPVSFGAFTYAQAQGRPWAVYSPFSLIMRSIDVPPWGPGLRPVPGVRGRVRDALVRRLAERAYQRALEPRPSGSTRSRSRRFS